MFRSLLIDDEQGARQTLKNLLSAACPEVEVIGECGSVKEGRQRIQELKPDLVFLDVHLTDGEGFDLLQQLPSLDFHVIFITGFDTFAIQAIRYSAVDYLVKPVVKEELREAVNRLIKKTESITNSFSRQPADPVRIALPDRNGLKVVDLSKVIYCESEGNYTRFMLTDNTNLLVTRTLKEYDALLSQRTFVRIHNSHIVNLSHVRSYVKGRGGQVEMSNGKFLEIARSRKQNFLDRLTNLST